jgi:hypothetical protein
MRRLRHRIFWAWPSRRLALPILVGVELVGCTRPPRPVETPRASPLRIELARRYRCPPGTIADTATSPILTWLQVGVGMEPCELLAHYPAVPRVVQLRSRGGLLRERWEFYYADPARHWDIFFQGVTEDRLRAVRTTEPRVRG